MPVDPKDWEWFGVAGHYICAHECQFHLCTRVGMYLISTVGEKTERVGEPPFEDIGPGAKYETMVFPVIGNECDREECHCNMPGIDVGDPYQTLRCNIRGDAQENHITMCRKYAEKSERGV